mmetsp:Transcript_37330/g.120593  ORF Transcript_37330/g.120593 Transcript_37330/m.120593 type:complete len:242 (+) Transcript_37330:230-955(+)
MTVAAPAARREACSAASSAGASQPREPATATRASLARQSVRARVASRTPGRSTSTASIACSAPRRSALQKRSVRPSLARRASSHARAERAAAHAPSTAGCDRWTRKESQRRGRSSACARVGVSEWISGEAEAASAAASAAPTSSARRVPASVASAQAAAAAVASCSTSWRSAHASSSTAGKPIKSRGLSDHTRQRCTASSVWSSCSGCRPPRRRSSCSVRSGHRRRADLRSGDATRRLIPK